MASGLDEYLLASASARREQARVARAMRWLALAIVFAAVASAFAAARGALQ